MTLEQLMKVAEDSNPALLNTINLAYKVAERMDPEIAQEIVRDWSTIADYMNEKTAGIAKDIAKGVAIGAGTAVGTGIATAVLTDMYEATKRGLTKGRNWRLINQYCPDLREKTPNPHMLRPAYNLLHKVAPEITAQPMAAVPVLLQLSQDVQAKQFNLLKDIADTRKSLNESKTKLFPVKMHTGGGKDGGGKRRDEAPKAAGDEG